jgi:hypothetical protein
MYYSAADVRLKEGHQFSQEVNLGLVEYSTTTASRPPTSLIWTCAAETIPFATYPDISKKHHSALEIVIYVDRETVPTRFATAMSEHTVDRVRVSCTPLLSDCHRIFRCMHAPLEQSYICLTREYRESIKIQSQLIQCI